MIQRPIVTLKSHTAELSLWRVHVMYVTLTDAPDEEELSCYFDRHT